MRYVDVAALFAAAILRRNPESVVVPLDTRAYDVRIDPSVSILSLSERLAKYGGGGTDCSIPLRMANRKFSKQAFAGCVLVSDNESWVGTGRYGSTGVMTEWQKFVKMTVKNQKSLGITDPKLVWTSSPTVRRRLAWAANQRKQEHVDDRRQVQLVGEKQTARTLIALSSIDVMPWSRLSTVAEWFAVMRSRDGSVFSEQVRRARQATPPQWEDACRLALKHTTGLFDSHPCLRDRLRAIGVSPKQAISLAAKLRPGETDPSAFIGGWDAIDTAMSAFLIALVQKAQQDKREIAAIVLGRSGG